MSIFNFAYLDPSVVTIMFSAIIGLAIVFLVPGIIALCVVSSVKKRRKSVERTLRIKK